MHIKTIKVQSRYRTSARNVMSKKGTETKVPEIRLSGNWLVELGVTIGSNVAIETTKAGILLKPKE